MKMKIESLCSIKIVIYLVITSSFFYLLGSLHFGDFPGKCCHIFEVKVWFYYFGKSNILKRRNRPFG